ncbi:hypothetical protein AA103196_1395 [Ameyamaea chiangmaiensis NBRC 103196]|uniref:Uncharacterized protein n=1 Tax=Ameyamaea chiangmaiensis TaxID=442969 RepID=A0A850PHP0_9PROT|nr:hypothetical protein [Ameyamaea chiangmaiensis]MBS4075217.1 hypothetical protein [Ameyamaea chiangmaiensis]NVN41756.1 hypothetical protein [Ameyamaea chiangmaiensis]GBQ66435.1 hypothetical protein AA103196_1395 [Ameyamaea chiangmaiensis NBRC 103196]
MIPSQTCPPPPILVEVFDVADARQALAALSTRPGTGTLISPPGAGAYLGPAWWHALMAACVAPDVALCMPPILDCGVAAGRAAEAVRLGIGAVILARHAPGFDSVAALAAEAGVLLTDTRAPSIPLVRLEDAMRQLPSSVA